jgi:hypothetical protein
VDESENHQISARTLTDRPDINICRWYRDKIDPPRRKTAGHPREPLHSGENKGAKWVDEYESEALVVVLVLRNLHHEIDEMFQDFCDTRPITNSLAIGDGLQRFSRM